MTLSHRDGPGSIGDTRHYPCPSKHRNFPYEAPGNRLGCCKRLPKRPRQHRRLHDLNASTVGPGQHQRICDWQPSLGVALEPGCSQGGVDLWVGDELCHLLDMARA
jgi:hypothetical protein